MPEGSNINLRDWLAGQALTAILGNPNTPQPGVTPFQQHAESIAQQAYGYAEAMLRERDAQHPPE